MRLTDPDRAPATVSTAAAGGIAAGLVLMLVARLAGDQLMVIAGALVTVAALAVGVGALFWSPRPNYGRGYDSGPDDDGGGGGGEPPVEPPPLSDAEVLASLAAWAADRVRGNVS